MDLWQVQSWAAGLTTRYSLPGNTEGNRVAQKGSGGCGINPQILKDIEKKKINNFLSLPSVEKILANGFAAEQI